MAEQVGMPFGRGQICKVLRNHVLYAGVHMGATWRIRLNNVCLIAMRAVATITVTTSVIEYTRKPSLEVALTT